MKTVKQSNSSGNPEYSEGSLCYQTQRSDTLMDVQTEEIARHVYTSKVTSHGDITVQMSNSNKER